MKEIQQVRPHDLATLRGINSKGMKPKQWRLMPLMWDDHEYVTSWGIYELDPEAPKDSGDIREISEEVPYWAGMELVRAHNQALGFYTGE